MPAARNIKLIVEYDGTPYLGWQRQKDGPSVEAELERAFHEISGESPKLTAAGRTDAGVHALGQVVSFRTGSAIEDWRIAHALNAHLPETITVHDSREVAEGFNARLDSLAKRYRYRVYQGPHLPALARDRAWHHRSVLDVAAMEEAAAELLGERDFESFRSVHCDAEHAIREMLAITIERVERPPVGFFLDFHFHANAFCRHMCRILAGTLCEVGRGRIIPAQIVEIRDARDRKRAGVTAPPEGLTLLEVYYP